jgi:hypothetical protein
VFPDQISQPSSRGSRRGPKHRLRHDTTCCPCVARSVTKFAHANRPYDYGSGQLMIGTELMLFFGLPSMTLSL